MATLLDAHEQHAKDLKHLIERQTAQRTTHTEALAERQRQAQWVAAKTAALGASEAQVRAALGTVPLPSDAVDLAGKLESTLADLHDTTARGLAIDGQVTDATAQVAAAQGVIGWAQARAAAVAAEVQRAKQREKRIADTRAALAAAPLATLKADAKKALTSPEWTDATARINGDIPKDLRERAKAGAAAAMGAAQAASDALEAAQDALANVTADPVDAAALRFERSDAAYHALLGGATELARVVAIVKAVPAAPKLTQAEKSKLGSYNDKAHQDAIKAEATRATADSTRADNQAAADKAVVGALVAGKLDPSKVQAVIDALAAVSADPEIAVTSLVIAADEARRAYEAARAAALAAHRDKDPDTDPHVVTVKAKSEAADQAVETAINATAVPVTERGYAGAWQAAAPDAEWQLVVALADAEAVLTRLKTVDPAAALATLRAVEDTYADALTAQAERATADRLLQAEIEIRTARAAALTANQPTRVLSAARGDG